MKTTMKTTTKTLVKTGRMLAALVLTWTCLGASAQAQVQCVPPGTLLNSLSVNFGNHTSLTDNDAASTGNLRLRCRNQSGTDRRLKICLELGSGSAGLVGSLRALQGAGSSIAYQIYRDAARSLVFGLAPDHAEFTTTLAGSATNFQQINTGIRFYGRIFAGQTVIANVGGADSRFGNPDFFLRYSDYAPGEAAPDCASRTGTLLNVGATNIRVRVQTTCAVSINQHVVFPDQTLLAQNVDSTGTIRVSCTPNVPYTIAISDGLHAQGTQRRMRYGNNLIHYDLFRDASHTQRWGSDAAERQARIGSNTSGWNYTVYARVPSGQPPAPPGDYKDTVLVTVDY